MKHTKGPWKLTDPITSTLTNVHTGEKIPGHVSQQIMSHEGRGALMIRHNGSEEGQANAALAASAPELLDLIRVILVWNEDLQAKVMRCQNGHDPREQTLAAMIVSVLAKAGVRL